MESSELIRENNEQEGTSKLALVSFVTAIIYYFLISLILIGVEYFFFLDKPGGTRVFNLISSLIFGPFCIVTGIIALRKIKSHKWSMVFASAGITYGFLTLKSIFYMVYILVIELFIMRAVIL